MTNPPPRCKAFDDCIQPHICAASTACIWGDKEEREEFADLLDKGSWNAAIDEVLAKLIEMHFSKYVLLEIQRLKK